MFTLEVEDHEVLNDKAYMDLLQCELLSQLLSEEDYLKHLKGIIDYWVFSAALQLKGGIEVAIPNAEYRELLIASFESEGVRASEEGEYLIVRWFISRPVVIHNELREYL